MFVFCQGTWLLCDTAGMSSYAIRLPGLLIAAALLASASPALAASDPIPVTVATINVWHHDTTPERHAGLVAIFQSIDAEVLLLQELNRRADAETLRAGLEAVTDEKWTLRQFEPNNDCWLLTSLDVTTPDDVRTMHVATTAGGTPLALRNVHLAHAPYGPYQLAGIPYHGGRILDSSAHGTKQRVEHDQWAARGGQVLAALQEIEGFDSSQTPSVLAGDFNEPSAADWRADSRSTHRALGVDWPTHAAVTDAGWIDAWRSTYPNAAIMPGNTWSPIHDLTSRQRASPELNAPLEPQDRIDFIYVRGPVAVESIDTVAGPADTEATLKLDAWNLDHRGVRAILVVGAEHKTGSTAGSTEK